MFWAVWVVETREKGYQGVTGEEGVAMTLLNGSLWVLAWRNLDGSGASAREPISEPSAEDRVGDFD